jgi:hypothetical protein
LGFYILHRLRKNIDVIAFNWAINCKIAIRNQNLITIEIYL